MQNQLAVTSAAIALEATAEQAKLAVMGIENKILSVKN